MRLLVIIAFRELKIEVTWSVVSEEHCLSSVRDLFFLAFWLCISVVNSRRTILQTSSWTVVKVLINLIYTSVNASVYNALFGNSPVSV